MNINEQLELDRQLDAAEAKMNLDAPDSYQLRGTTEEEIDAQIKAEAELIIQEAVDRGGEQFLAFLFGWMKNEHTTEIAKAAESWIETDNFTLPEED